MFNLDKEIEKAKKIQYENGEAVISYITCACGHRHVYEVKKGEQPKLIVILDSTGFPINET